MLCWSTYCRWQNSINAITRKAMRRGLALTAFNIDAFLTSLTANCLGRPLNQVTVCTIFSFLKPLLTVLTSFSWWRGTVVERRSLAGDLSLSCVWPAADGWPLMCVNRPLQPTGQPTRSTQLFIRSRSINWVVSCSRMFASSHEWRRLVNAYGVKAWCGWLERWCVC